MEYVFVTEPDYRAYTIAAKAIRKTSSKALRIFSNFFAIFFTGMILLMIMYATAIVYGDEDIGAMMPVLGIFFLMVIVFYFIFQDSSNGSTIRERTMKGAEKTTIVFASEAYTVAADTVKSEYQYNGIDNIAETTNYFVLVLGINRAVICDKRGISQGTVEDFRGFIEEKTNKKIISIKE